MNFGDALSYTSSFFGLYTLIFVFLTSLEDEAVRREKVWKKLPRVCIAVPCFNEEKRVGRTLESLLALDYPKDKLEIIAVDDGSTDGTLKVLKQFEKRGVRVVHKENGGKHTALNVALRMTSAEFFGGLDADSVVDPKALRRILRRFYADYVMAVTPAMKIESPNSILRKVQSVEFIVGILLREIFTKLGSQHVTPGPFTIYRRDFFEKFGPFKKAHLTEDIEIALRIQKNNFFIENAVDAYVFTHGPAKFAPLFRQRLRWFYGYLSNVLDYFDLLNPKKFGNLGFFVLPQSFLFIGLIILAIAYTGFRFVKNSYTQLLNAIAVHFDVLRLIRFNFEWFFVNTKPTMILSLFTLAGSFCIFLFARLLSRDRRRIGFDYALFLLLYWFLFGLWWAVAVWRKVFRMPIMWSEKQD
ncbi:glycosyltransferase family 2 protein [Candidatus Woesearchaeota archaeon]|nr:MAG: glycosyltransferase family 2 protein [Candidatus Woesearchaeota archaeon]